MSNAKTSTIAPVDSESLVLIVNSTGSCDTPVADSPYRMYQPNCVVGSGPKANWVVSNAELKPEHAEFVRLSFGAYVRGLDAPTDELLVNGEPVNESWIHSGDRLTMGTMELLVEGIGKVEFGSCDKLESLIVRSSDSPGKSVAQEQCVSSAHCINYLPAEIATAELATDATTEADNEAEAEAEVEVKVEVKADVEAEVKAEENATKKAPTSLIAESDDNPWFLVDSLVDDVETYECDSASDDEPVSEELDCKEAVGDLDLCELTSETEWQAPQEDSTVSELDEVADIDATGVEQDSMDAFVESKSDESKDSCFHDADLNDLLDDMADPCFEMPVETEVIQSREQQESDGETVFKIPRIATEACDNLETTDADHEPVVVPVRSEDGEQEYESELSSETDSASFTSGLLTVDVSQVESPCEADEADSEFLSDKPAPVMPRQTDRSSEQASWLNELYDSIIPDEHDNTGTPIAENSDDADDASAEPEAQTEDSSWLTNRPFDLSGLMKPGVDPESVSSLPDTNDKHAAELFDKFDSNDRDTENELVNEFATESPDAESLEAQSAHDDDSPESNMLNAEAGEAVEQVSEMATESPAPALSVAEVLEKMSQTGEVALDFDDDPQPSTPVSNEATEAPPTTAAEGEKKDDVGDYMSQLLNRLRGGTPSPEPTKPAEKAKVSVAPVQDAKKQSKKDIDDLVPENPLKADEYVSKSTLPEKPGSLTALRQIANQSVHTAIQRSLQNKNQHSSTMYLAGSGFAFFLSVVLFIMSNGWFDLAFIAACISSIACALSGYMFVSVNNGLEKLLEYRKQKQEDKQSDKAEVASTEQPKN